MKYTLDDIKCIITVNCPLFSSLLVNLPVEITDKIPTLGVDGKKLYVNENFLSSLPMNEQVGVVMHECLHLALGHIWRGEHFSDIAVDPKSGQTVSLYNIAADYVINAAIKEYAKVTGLAVRLPSTVLYDKKYDRMSTEEVYHLLRNSMKSMNSKEMQNIIDEHLSCGDKSKWKDAKGAKGDMDGPFHEKKWRTAIEAGKEQEKKRGTMPQGLDRSLEVEEPQEDWRAILREHVQPFDNDFSFNPPDRRSLDWDFLLPDIKQGEKVDWIAVAIDTSGSISVSELSKFLGELKGILSSFDKVKVKLTFCDAKATDLVEMEEFDTSKIQVKGGGGTDFEPVFDLVKKEDDDPCLLVYFTDLEGDFPNEAPEYDVLWLSTQKSKKAPFGNTIFYETE